MTESGSDIGNLQEINNKSRTEQGKQSNQCWQAEAYLKLLASPETQHYPGHNYSPNPALLNHFHSACPHTLHPLSPTSPHSSSTVTHYVPV